MADRAYRCIGGPYREKRIECPEGTTSFETRLYTGPPSQPASADDFPEFKTGRYLLKRKDDGEFVWLWDCPV